MKQVEIPELREAIARVLGGSDPLQFVNTFMRRPLEAPNFPQEYWLQRICAVAEILANVRPIHMKKSLETFVSEKTKQLEAFQDWWEAKLNKGSPDETPDQAYAAPDQVWKERFEDFLSETR